MKVLSQDDQHTYGVSRGGLRGIEIRERERVGDGVVIDTKVCVSTHP